MGSEWKEFELGQLLDVVTDIYKPNKNEVLPYLGLEHIEQGTLRLSGIGMSTDIISNKYRFEPNDILFGKLRPYFRKVYKPRFSGVCSTDIMVLRTKDCNIADQSFLFYVIASKKFIDIATASSKGTKMPRADWNHLKKVMIKLPPLPEQQKIASILSAFDDKIELNNEMNKTLEEIAQAIFKHWFIDFEFPNENGEPYKSSGGEFVDSELGPIPKGWKVGFLGEIIDITSGKRPLSRSNEKDMEHRVPLVGASSIMGYVKEVLYNEPIIIIGRVGTLGVVQRYSEPIWASDNTLVIKSSSYEYVYQLLKLLDYSSLNRGSTQPLLTQNDIKNLSIAIPVEDILHKFEELSSSIYRKVQCNKKENDILSQLRDTLLPKLISGEIRVM